MIDFSDKEIFKKLTQFTELESKLILEIGCGNGRISSLIATVPCHLIAIDPDENEINNARKKVSGVDFRIGSGEDLSFPNNYFDLVIFTLSLHHQNSQIALKEAVRTLKPNGQIIVIEPTVEGELEQVCTFIHNENQNIKNAQTAISNSELSIVESEIFTANWEFSDKDDLLNSLFQHYNIPYQPDIAQEIENYIGEKIHSTPIILQDVMIIQTLKPPNELTCNL